MGMWDKIKASVSRKERQGTGLELSRWIAPPPRRGTPELLRAYREMPALKLCVETVADSVADVQWKVWRRVDKSGKSVKDYSMRAAPFRLRSQRLKALAEAGEIEERVDHPALRLIADPNDFFTGRAVMKLIDTHKSLVGEAFLVLERVGGVVVGYWPVPPAWVTRLPDYSKPRDERTYTITISGKQALLPASDVIYLRDLDPEDPLGRGVGTAATLGDELDTDEYAARFTKNSFFNNMVPAAVVGIEGMPQGKNEAAERFRQDLVREHQGAERAGKVMITGGKVSFTRLDTPFRDMALVDLRRFLLDFCRMAYRVPPEVIGNTANSNKATAYAARELLAEQVTIPRAEFLRTELQKWLMPLFADAFGDEWVLDYESPVPADKEFKFRVMATQPAGWDWKEWRALVGDKPHPDLSGFPALLPGQKPEEGAQTPTPEEGGAAEAQAEAREKRAPTDPPWATSAGA